MKNAIQQTLAQLGWLNGCLYLLDRVLARLTADRIALFKYQFVAQPVGRERLDRQRGASITVQLLTRREQLPPAYPRPAAVLDQRYAQGAQSLAAWRGDELIGFLWLLVGVYHEDEVRARYCPCAAHVAWDFDVYVRPEDRLGWAFLRLWEEARRLLQARGVHWSCSRISAFNPASLRAHARLGAVKLGSATFLRCGSWQWMVATLPPYIHFSASSSSCPQLLLDTSELSSSPTEELPCRHLNESESS